MQNPTDPARPAPGGQRPDGLPSCDCCGDRLGPFRPTGERYPDGAQALACPAHGTPQAAPESLVLSAHTLGILARHVSGRLGDDQAARAFVTALEDAAALAEAWVSAQLDTLATPSQTAAQPAAAPLVAPVVAPAPAQPATSPQPLTATAAVLAATFQVPQGATAREIAAHVAAVHALEVTPETVRAIRSKHRRGQAQPVAQHGTGMYL